MPSWQDWLYRNISDFFNAIGIDPLLPLILIFLLIGIKKVKHIKQWNTLTVREKRWDILYWLILIMALLLFVGKTIRGD